MTKPHACILVLVASLLCISATSQAEGFHNAVRHNKIDRVDYMIKNGPPGLVNQRISGGATALHISSAMNYTDMTRLLIKQGAKLNAITENGFAPIHWAASKDAINSIEILLAEGVDVNFATTNGITPLHWASQNNATKAVEYLARMGADIEAETNNKLKPIHWAVRTEAETTALQLATMEINTNDPAIPTNEVITIKGKRPLALPKMIETKKGAELQLPLSGNTAMAFAWIKDLDCWVGKFEVTNVEFRHFKPDHASISLKNFDMNITNHPAAGVSWHEASAFCNWLTDYYSDLLPEQYVYRLPSEWEWEQFAKCGKDIPYPWGKKWPPRYGNFSDISSMDHLPSWTGLDDYDDGYVATCPVDKSGRNRWGLHGIGGNVSEWCQDWYSAKKSYKVRKGGGWCFDKEPSLRIVSRGFDRPAVRYFNNGFRVIAARALDLPHPTSTQDK